jgi:hypothetical protein
VSGHEKGRPGERPLPFFGLASSAAAERAIVAWGWDVNSVAHRLGREGGELVVGVDRRATAEERSRPGRVPISEQLARKSMATVLAADLPGIGQDLYEVTADLAGEGWRECRMEIDGDTFDAHEREFKGQWIRYCLTPELIVFVIGPVALRLDSVSLESLEPDELEQVEGSEDPVG